MGRIYDRKTKRGADGDKYSISELQQAIHDVKNGKWTVRGASKHFNIPRTTLRHHVAGTRGVLGSTAGNGKGGGGSLSIPFADEERLAQAIRSMEKWGLGISRDEVLDLVQTYVKVNNIKTKFKHARPGASWFVNFRKRHALSIKKPQCIEHVRMSQINPFIVNGFFDLLSETIDRLQLNHRPQQIFNLDETSFAHDPSKTKVVGAVGARSKRMVSSPGRENTSVLICCSAFGEKLPPLCIFKGKNVIESWLNRDEADRTIYAASKRGWMESTIFLNWFTKCFLEHATKERPILLIYDGHVSHLSLELLETACENNIVILKLPPHTTHVLQPLDVCVFKPFKTDWDKQLIKWQRHNPRRRIPKSEFVKILNRVYEGISVSTIISGFKCTGIYDENALQATGSCINRNAIKQDLYKPADIKRYEKYLSDHKKPQTNHPVVFALQTEEIVPVITENFERDSEPVPELPSSHGTAISEPIPELPASLGIADSEPVPDFSAAFVDTTLPQNQPEASTSGQQQATQTNYNKKHTFDDIILKFLNDQQPAPQPSYKKRRICSGAELITTKEYLDKIQEKEGKGPIVKRISKPTKKYKEKLQETSSSSDEDVCNLQDSSDGEDCTDTVLPVIDDFVIVLYNQQHYPGQVNNVTENSVTIKHMVRCGKFCWRWPEKDDILDYANEDIVKIIPPPVLQNKRGMYSIPEMKRFLDF